MRTRIKICGVCREADARLACQLGADAVGVVLVPESRRCASLEEATALRSAVTGLTSMVVLFADAPPDRVWEAIDRVRPDLLQFHGGEDARYCEQFGFPYIKALSHSVARESAAAFGGARALVVDSHAPGALGGSGASFDWTTFPGNIDRPLFLAGGLSAGNVAAAVTTASPYGVDVASGIEAAPGIKDAALMRQFFSEVIRGDSSKQD